jgi:hypothetical protein
MFEKGDIVKVANIKDKFKGYIGEINYVMTDGVNMYIVDLLGEPGDIISKYVGISNDFELVCKAKDRQDNKLTDEDRITFLEAAIDKLKGDGLWIRGKNGYFVMITDTNIRKSIDERVLLGNVYE